MLIRGFSGNKFEIHAWSFIREEGVVTTRTEEWFIIGIIFSSEISGTYFLGME